MRSCEPQDRLHLARPVSRQHLLGAERERRPCGFVRAGARPPRPDRRARAIAAQDGRDLARIGAEGQQDAAIEESLSVCGLEPAMHPDRHAALQGLHIVAQHPRQQRGAGHVGDASAGEVALDLGGQGAAEIAEARLRILGADHEQEAAVPEVLEDRKVEIGELGHARRSARVFPMLQQPQAGAALGPVQGGHDLRGRSFGCGWIHDGYRGPAPFSEGREVTRG